MVNLKDGYEITKFINGQKMTLVWWNEEDWADTKLPTLEELFNEANRAAKLVMEAIHE